MKMSMDTDLGPISLWDQFWRFALYFPLGCITMWGWTHSMSEIAWGLFLGFVFYEAIERLRIPDRSYIDVRGWLAGLFWVVLLHLIRG